MVFRSFDPDKSGVWLSVNKRADHPNNCNEKWRNLKSMPITMRRDTATTIATERAIKKKQLDKEGC